MIALSKVALLWWAATSDDFHVTTSGLGSTPIPADPTLVASLATRASVVQEALQKNIIYTKYAGQWMGNYDVKYVRDLTDVIDQEILQAIGLGDYWPDLELFYSSFLKATGERPGTRRALPEFSA
jgi:hypothetical protein